MYTGILLVAALLPAALLMLYIYHKDTVEKEPVGLIARMFFLGMLIGPLAAYLEDTLIALIDALPLSAVSLIILENFIGIALVEEGFKYIFLNTIKNNRHFNYVFDGIVYGVAVSLGFAALENVLYVFDGGLEVAVMRALLSVPGHCADGVLMGLLFGLAKKYEMQKNRSLSLRYYVLAFFVPMLEHGFYDMALSTENDLIALLGVLVDVGFIVAAFVLVNIISKNDEAIYGEGHHALDWAGYAAGQAQAPLQQAQAYPQAYAQPAQGYQQPAYQQQTNPGQQPVYQQQVRPQPQPIYQPQVQPQQQPQYQPQVQPQAQPQPAYQPQAQPQVQQQPTYQPQPQVKQQPTYQPQQQTPFQQQPAAPYQAGQTGAGQSPYPTDAAGNPLPRR